MSTYTDHQQRELDAASGAEMDRRAARWHFPPEAFPAMRHISAALPPSAAEAVRLPDITSLLDYWTRVGAYLEAMGERPATWREVHPVFRDGYGIEAGAEEIADRRALLVQPPL